jgi:para-aminobenzoate synthetase
MIQLCPRILYIDADDSFSNNIVAILQTSLGAEVEVVKHLDDHLRNLEDEEFTRFLGFFDAVVAGPGPGTATSDADVGIIRRLWNLKDVDILPVFAICLGFQSMCDAFGARIETLCTPRHGIVHPVVQHQSDMFEGMDDFRVTSYHSLHVNIGQSHRTKNLAGLDHAKLWQKGIYCPNITPLAWDISDVKNGAVLMAARHNRKPFWGVQYHPESICTTDEGRKVIPGWWEKATKWIENHPRNVNRGSIPVSRSKFEEDTRKKWSFSEAIRHVQLLKMEGLIDFGDIVRWKTVETDGLDINDFCKLLRVPKNEGIVLRSGLLPNGQPISKDLGRYTIIGHFSQHSNLHIQYEVGVRQLTLSTTSVGGKSSGHFDGLPFKSPVQDIWAYLKGFMNSLECHGGSPDIPFWGGLMGYVSYEAGLETIAATSPWPINRMQHDGPSDSIRPDINFVLNTRSIVIDHLTNKVYIQSIQADDENWITRTADVVSTYAYDPKHESYRPHFWIPKVPSFLTKSENFNHWWQRRLYNPDINVPKELATCENLWRLYLQNKVETNPPDYIAYAKKILLCEWIIRQGISYELCLTDKTKVLTSSAGCPSSSGWLLFEALSKSNPSPFSAYMRLQSPSDAVTIVSSSPERFLSWDRGRRCQFRPIKGTVKKAPGVTREHAEAVLNSSKERAENLMITDLIRHDLHGVAGAGNVRVPKLMGIEEYSTVYQLVSVIEGNLSQAENVGYSAPAKTGEIKNRRWSFSDLSSAGRHGLTKVTRSAQSGRRGSETVHETQNPILLALYPSLADKPFSSLRNVRMEAHQPEKFSINDPNVTSPINDLPPSGRIPGIDVLAASLPPGSMTGAPKKSSCEKLQLIENGEARGIYSGVVGYLDVGGGGDFSVVIRTAYRWDSDIRTFPETPVPETAGRAADAIHATHTSEEVESQVFEEWTIGAGGAITAQSNADAEYDEMLTKLNSVLGAFDSRVEKQDFSSWSAAQYQAYLGLLKRVEELNTDFPGRIPDGVSDVTAFME